MFKKRFFGIFAAAILALSLASCSSTNTNQVSGSGSDTVQDKAQASSGTETGMDTKKDDEALSNKGTDSDKDDLKGKNFDEIIKLAKGSKVTFYGWGGDEKLNNWLDKEYIPLMKEKYDIEVVRVPMDIEQILTQLSGELQTGTDGSIDMIWINGENFQSARSNDMLYGPFSDMLPNFKQYIDADSDDIKYDFGYPVEGYEAPYGKAQVVFIADSAKTAKLPKNADELFEFAKENKGKITYPALPDFTGSVFVRSIIYEKCGYEQFQDMKPDKEKVKEAIEPALKYLRDIKPYLWNEGKTYPESSSTLENMFADGEVLLNVTYGAYSTSVNIEKGKYPNTAISFQFDKGTIGNTNFLAIAKNSPNKAGAMVAINEMISPEVQAMRFKELRTLPVIDYSKLDKQQKAAFDSVDIGKGNIPQDELLSKRLPEMPAELVPVIEEIWKEEVLNKD